MAEKKSTRPRAEKSPRANAKKANGFSDFERAAMKERVRELKANKADGEKDLLAKIAEMTGPDRAMAKRVHAIVRSAAPSLVPKTWYGMPAWANATGKVVCFFQSAKKFQARYATLGFSDQARLDDGAMWPTSFALTELTAAEEARITALVRQAAG